MSTQREDVGAPDEVATLALAELADGSATCVQLGDVPVAVARVGDDVYAIADTCSHGRASLTGGEFYADEYLLECPKHGSTFDVRTGVPTACRRRYRSPRSTWRSRANASPCVGAAQPQPHRTEHHDDCQP